MEKGVWYPEYHGNTHFNIFAWHQLLMKRDHSTLESFNQQVFINGNVEYNFEYDKRLSFKQQAAAITIGFNRFQKVFGYHPHSSIAPNYAWQTKTEKALAQRDIRIVQAKNWQYEQRSLLEKVRGKIINLLGKRSADKPWQVNMGDYNTKLQVFYLIRNVNFEPRGKKDSEATSGAEEAYRDIIAAWERNEPAIVNTHRINYAYLDSGFLKENLTQLDWLLNKVQLEHPEAVYSTDWELAQLYEDGTSVIHYPTVVICRNLTSQPQKFEVEVPENREVVCIENLKTKTRISFELRNDLVAFSAPLGHYAIHLK
jgi:hypothetical protein